MIAVCVSKIYDVKVSRDLTLEFLVLIIRFYALGNEADIYFITENNLNTHF